MGNPNPNYPGNETVDTNAGEDAIMGTVAGEGFDDAASSEEPSEEKVDGM